jgi:hypothetical protein
MPRHLQVALVLLLAAVCVMGFYALRLKRQAEALPQRVSDERPLAPPVTGPKQAVTLLVAHDDDGSLRQQAVSVALPEEPGARAREILRTLLSVYLDKNSPHPLGAGADVKDVFVIKGATAVVDVNAAFADEHRSGIQVEELTLDSVAETLATNMPGITGVKILVEGKERETLAGHADLMDVYEVGAGDQVRSQKEEVRSEEGKSGKER